MSRAATVAIVVLSIVCIGLSAVLLWHFVNDRADAALWKARDAERIRHSDEKIAEAEALHQLALGALKASDAKHETEKASLVAQLAAAQAERDKSPTPRTLDECLVNRKKDRDEIEMHKRNAELDLSSINALRGALGHEENRADVLEEAWKLERERAEGWRNYARKDERKEKRQKAFIGIGSGIALGFVGYGIGVTR